jgi:hypothetical protein
MSDTGVVEIHGKEYLTVARRIRDFRDKHPDYTISTEVLSAADVVQMKATISDTEGRVLATGHAEEIRGSTNILKTSSVETCETSSVGRCLSMLGFLGSEVAGAEEIANALEQQTEQEQVERLKAHNEALRDNIESVVAIKAYLLNEQWGLAYEAVAEIPADDRLKLWISTTAGGIWTTKERAQMKSNEWTAARKLYHGEDNG